MRAPTSPGRRRRAVVAGRLASAAIGAVAGTVAILSLAGMWLPASPDRTTGERPRPHGTRTDRSGPARAVPGGGRVLLAWAPGGLPHGAEARLERQRGVIHATTVHTRVEWLNAVHADDGTRLEQPPDGYGIPVEIAAVEPHEYARFVSPGERSAVLELGPDEVVLSAAGAALRGGSEGLRLRFGSKIRFVSGVVSDAAANGYEALVARPAGELQRLDSHLLIHLARPRARGVVERTMDRLLEAGRVARVRAEGETPYLRYGDAVQPQQVIKQAFGEFAGRPTADGRIVIEPGWVTRNIKEASVPILGRVRCHRALFPQLRGALRELEAEGLTYTIDRQGFAGCFAPRFIASDPDEGLSHHTWGVALDLNHSANAYGTKPDQDPRLVQIMRKWGFTWGGDWLIPDGMHFEWVRWP